MHRLLRLLIDGGGVALVATAFAATAGAQVLPPGSDSDCVGQVPVVVASDEAAQSDLYSAATLAGVLDTSCVVLAGARDEPMAPDQRARLDAAHLAGWVVGGEAAVPAAKVAGRDLKRLNGVDRWHTARLAGAVAADPDGDIAALTAATAPVAGAPGDTSVMVDGVEVRLPPGLDADCSGQVPIVVAADAAAQSDLYSAVTLAGVLDTSCIVLAGARGEPMNAEQQARLSVADDGGWVVGGEAAVPADKIAGFDLTRQGGTDRWATARLIGATAVTQAAAEPVDTTTTTERVVRRVSSGGGGGGRSNRRTTGGGGTTRPTTRPPTGTTTTTTQPRSTTSTTQPPSSTPSQTPTNWSVVGGSTASGSGVLLPPGTDCRQQLAVGQRPSAGGPARCAVADIDCSGHVPIVVASDRTAQSDLYSAVMLAGVIDTQCIVLAGPRDGAMEAAQVARLDAALADPSTEGWVMGGEAAVPAAKVAGRNLQRLNGVDDWHTVRLAAAVAVDPDGDIAALTAATAPAVGETGGSSVTVDGIEVRLPPGTDGDCHGQVPVVVAVDAAAQADLYAAAMLAAVLDTTCVVLAGVRSEAMPMAEFARLAAADAGGYVVGGEAAVPSQKIAAFYVSRLGGANQYETIRLIGGVAVTLAARDQMVPVTTTTSHSLEATIAAAPGSSFVKISFSVAVSDEAKNPDNYTVAGSALFEQDVICDSASDRASGQPCAPPGRLGPNEIAIVLDGYTLAEGDVIEIAGGRITSAQPGGARNHNLVLAATSFTVPAPIVDRNEPGVSVFTPAGANFVRVVVEEENAISGAGVLSEDEVWITIGGTVYTGDAAATRAKADGTTYMSQRLWVFPSADNKRYDIAWNCADDAADTNIDVDGDIGANGHITECDQTNVLAVGSTVEIVEGAIADGWGNASPRRRSLLVEVAANNDMFATQGSATLTAPAVHLQTGADGVMRPQNVEIEVLDGADSVVFKLTARSDGPNAGAAGNGWTFGLNRVADDDADVAPVAIAINERRRSIGVSYDDETTLHGLLQALQADETIAASFDVTIEGTWPATAYTDAIASTTTLFPRSGSNTPTAQYPTEVTTTGGLTSVKLTLWFEEVIKSFSVDTFAFGNSGSSFGPAAVAGANLATSVVKSPAEGPTRTVMLTYIYDNPANVPSGRLTVNVPAGTATNYSNVGNVRDPSVSVVEAR